MWDRIRKIIGRIVLVTCGVIEVLVWPVGVCLMLSGIKPDKVGDAMATVILVFSVPFFFIDQLWR